MPRLVRRLINLMTSQRPFTIVFLWFYFYLYVRRATYIRNYILKIKSPGRELGKFVLLFSVKKRLQNMLTLKEEKIYSNLSVCFWISIVPFQPNVTTVKLPWKDICSEEQRALLVGKPFNPYRCIDLRFCLFLRTCNSWWTFFQ